MENSGQETRVVTRPLVYRVKITAKIILGSTDGLY